MEKISILQELQDQVTDNYKQIMFDLVRFCEKIMGKRPCKFALTEMVP